jgi:hypothetical protein
MTTTPFDMVVRNDMDRFHLAMEVINRVPNLGYLAAYAKQAMRDKLIEHKEYIERHGDNPPESVIGMDRRVELQRKLGGAIVRRLRDGSQKPFTPRTFDSAVL